MLTTTESCVVAYRDVNKTDPATFTLEGCQEDEMMNASAHLDERRIQSSNRFPSHGSIVPKPHFISTPLAEPETISPSLNISQGNASTGLIEHSHPTSPSEQSDLRTWIRDQFENRTNSDWVIETLREMVEPLTCIAAYAMAGEQLARGSSKTVNAEAASDLFARITSEASRIGGIVRTATRNLRKRVIGSVLVNLRDLVDEAFDFASPLLLQYGFKPLTSIQTEMFVVTANVHMLQSVLQDMLLVMIRDQERMSSIPRTLQATIAQRQATALISIEILNSDRTAIANRQQNQTTEFMIALQSRCYVWNIALSSIGGQVETRKPRSLEESPSLHISIPMQGNNS